MSEASTSDHDPARAAPNGQPRWWGDYRLDAGDCRAWRIGPLQLLLQRDEADWRVAYASSAEASDEIRIAEPGDPALLPGMSPERFSFRRADGRLTLQARLADRPVVVRPADPLAIPPGEEVTLYVSSPVWVEVLVGRPLVSLAEIATHAPSDTWFGPSTYGGELCYAGRTLARRHYEDVQVLAHRAVTPVEIRNRAEDQFRLERLKLPMPNLALFVAPDGRLFSDAVQLTRLSPHEVQVTRKRSPERGAQAVKGLDRLASPRLAEEPAGALTRLTRWFE